MTINDWSIIVTWILFQVLTFIVFYRLGKRKGWLEACRAFRKNLEEAKAMVKEKAP